MDLHFFILSTGKVIKEIYFPPASFLHYLKILGVTFQCNCHDYTLFSR